MAKPRKTKNAKSSFSIAQALNKQFPTDAARIIKTVGAAAAGSSLRKRWGRVERAFTALQENAKLENSK
jgi:hypothetical protein